MRRRHNSTSSARKAALALAAMEAAGETVAVEELPMRTKMDSLLISSYDKQRLIKLLNRLDTTAEDRTDLEDLEQEIRRGAEVRPQEVPPDVVTMNSSVRVTDIDAGTEHVYTIVFPQDANYEGGKISILAPLGIALLGYRVGDVVEWTVPRGVRRLRIDGIVFQPEAAGNFDL